MRARAVCLPVGNPILIYRFPVFVVLSFAAMLLLSCNNTNDATGQQQLSTPQTTDDYAYSYSNEENVEAPAPANIRNYKGETDDSAPVASLAELKSVAQPRVQTFTVSAKKDTVITGNKGVMVHVPSGCFDVKGDAKVQIVMKEYNSTSDFFFANLTTSSNGQLLESGGTVYINAISDGRLVNLKKGKEISLAFPTGKAQPGMQTFYGEKKGDGINWQPVSTTRTNTNVFNNYYRTIYYPRVPADKRLKYNSVKVKKTKMCQQYSTLTSANFQIQAMGSNGYCTRYTDTSTYNNVLEYFADNFTLDTKDFLLLQNTYLTYNYMVKDDGSVVNVELKDSYSPKPSLAMRKAKKEVLKRVKNQLTTLLNSMPKAEGTPYMHVEVLKIYVADFSSFTGTPVVKIKNEKVQREYYTYESVVDSFSLCIYNEWADSVRKAQYAKYDSLMRSDAGFYFINSGKLGWINCDRFYDNGKPKGNIFVNGGGNKNLSVRVIFKNIMSVMDMYANTTGYYQADNLPMGEKVRYIVMQKRADGMYYAVKDAVTSDVPVSGFTFKPMTMNAIKNELASL